MVSRTFRLVIIWIKPSIATIGTTCWTDYWRWLDPGHHHWCECDSHRSKDNENWNNVDTTLQTTLENNVWIEVKRNIAGRNEQEPDTKIYDTFENIVLLVKKKKENIYLWKCLTSIETYIIITTIKRDLPNIRCDDRAATLSNKNRNTWEELSTQEENVP